MKYREVASTLEEKLGLDFRQGKDRSAWFVFEGKKRLRVTVPKTHSGDLAIGTLTAIRKQLTLATGQFLDLVRCPMTGTDFEQVVRQKIEQGLL
jgi:predicted RNA binding protein YcfA (HicA-like mRNA interferase family)